MASLLSGVDVHCRNRVGLSAKSVGILYRHLSRGPLGLRQHICNDVLFQRLPATSSLASHRPSGTARPGHRDTGVVFKSGGHNRLHLGVLPAAKKTDRRRGQAGGDIRSDHGVFRFRHGLVSASVSRDLPSSVAPPFALILRLFPQPLGWPMASTRQVAVSKRLLCGWLTTVFPFSCPASHLGLHFWLTACFTCIQIMTGASEAVFEPTQVRTRKGRVLAVRAYGCEDFAALVEMYASFEPKRVAQGLPPPDVPRISGWLDQLQRKSHQLLAFESTKIVAHTILCPIRQPEIEFTIFVHQDYREDTLGTAMSELTLAWSLEMGFSKVLLTTEFSNYRAIGLFRKLGFHTSSSYGDECEMVVDLPGESKAKAA